MRHPRPLLFVMVLLAALMLLVAACQPEADDDPVAADDPADTEETPDADEPEEEPAEEEPAEEEPAEPHELTLAVAAPGIPFLQLDVAEAEGFYADHNLEVESLAVEGSAAATASVEAGEADIMVTLPEGVITARAAGSTLTMIGATVNENLYRFYVTDDIETLDDLAGKNVAMFVEGNGTHIQAQWLLDEHGAGQEQTTFIATGGLPTRLAALLEGQVSGSLLFPPFDVQGERQGLEALVVMGDFVDGYPNEVISARQERLAEDPEAFRAFMAAMEDATQWLLDNTEEAIDLAVELTGDDRDVVAEAYAFTQPTFGTRISDEGLEWTLEVMERYLVTDDPMPAPDELYDPSFHP